MARLQVRIMSVTSHLMGFTLGMVLVPGFLPSVLGTLGNEDC